MWDEFRNNTLVWLWDRFAILNLTRCDWISVEDGRHYKPMHFVATSVLCNLIVTIADFNAQGGGRRCASGHLQGSFREASRKLQGSFSSSFMEASRKLQGSFRAASASASALGHPQSSSREASRKLQGSFRFKEASAARRLLLASLKLRDFSWRTLLRCVSLCTMSS